MRKWVRKTVIILFWLALWQGAAVWVHNPILLAGPVQVMQAFGQNLLRADFLKIIFCSFSRIGLGFFLALFAGLVFGALSYRIPLAEEAAAPFMAALKSVPVASFVVILLIWFGSGRLSLFISFLIVFPNVYVSTLAGFKSADIKLLEMAQVFSVSRRNRFFYIYKPALMPYLNSCLKVSLGMSWKSGVAAEVIGLPAYSLGERLYMSKIYLDTAGVFAWTLTVILISYLFEKAVLRLTNMVDIWKPYPMPGSSGKKHVECERQEAGYEGADGKKRIECGRQEAGFEGADGKKRIECGRQEAGFEGADGKKHIECERQEAGFERADGKKRIEYEQQESRCKDENVGRDFEQADSRDGCCIQICHVSKSYGGMQVLQDYSLMLQKGKRYLLTAPSGAGKTTLLRILTGLDSADRGVVKGIPERVGMVFQEDRLCEDYNAVCNIMLGMGKLMDRTVDGVRLSRRQAAEAVRAEAVRILPADCLDQPVRELSGGMRRRVALLRAVLSDADFLILDEPFTGLDEENRIRCGEYLLEHLAGKTLLATSHRAQDAELLQGIKVTLVFSKSLCYNA